MTKISRVIGVMAVGGLLGGACSSSSPSTTGSGGTTSTGGKSASGGTTGTGGTASSTGGVKGTGGATSTGGATGTGGTAGSGGAAGGMSGGELVVACQTGGAGGAGGTTSTGGSGVAGGGGMSSSAGGQAGGSAGKGGGGKGGQGGSAAGGAGGGSTGAAGAGGAAPSCTDFPSAAKGSSTFMISSSEWTSCMPIPAEHTCDQKAFPMGTSPALTWTAGPAGTMSYAIVLKDLSVLARYASTDSNYNKGFHYVMWDIPANVTSLPKDMKNGFVSQDVSGAMQWSNFNDYGFFGPCPNFDPMNPTSYDDSYSFIVYALPTAKTDIPAPQAGISTVRVMDGVFQQNALAVAEYRGMSNASSSTLPSDVLPPKDVVPCPTDGSVTCGCVKRAP